MSLSYTPARLFQTQPSVTDMVLYTAPSTVLLRELVIGNPSTITVDVSLSLVPASGTVGDGTHLLLHAQSVAAGQSLVLDVWQSLNSTDQICGSCSALGVVQNVSGTVSASGGTIGASGLYYVVTAVNDNGETLRSAEITVTPASGTTNSIVLAWDQLLGARGYKVYKGTSAGAENTLVGSVLTGVTTTFTDTGAAGTALSPLLVATAGAAVFTCSGVTVV